MLEIKDKMRKQNIKILSILAMKMLLRSCGVEFLTKCLSVFARRVRSENALRNQRYIPGEAMILRRQNNHFLYHNKVRVKLLIYEYTKMFSLIQDA